MALHLRRDARGFGPGRTVITRVGEKAHDTGISLEVFRFSAGERVEQRAARETAWLLVGGELTVEAGGARHRWRRGSLFDELPWALHAGAGTAVTWRCVTDVELLVAACANRAALPAVVYTPADVRVEARGAGSVDDAALRQVRTVFDLQNADPRADLVLGEVVTLPGRWSSYPPHHHPQPELYHYRFDRAEGYGHAELGEAVVKVRHGDTVKILRGDHAQVAAPGYAMYYLWVIRHLPRQRYDAPVFAEEHRWTMAPGASAWRPR